MPDVVRPFVRFGCDGMFFDGRRERLSAVLLPGGGFGLPARPEGPKGTLFSEKFELTAS